MIITGIVVGIIILVIINRQVILNKVLPKK